MNRHKSQLRTQEWLERLKENGYRLTAPRKAVVEVIAINKAIATFKVNRDNIRQALDKNPILVTALNPVIGYEKGAATAKKAYKEKRPILEVARETTGLSQSELKKLLDPLDLTRGGIRGGK